MPRGIPKNPKPPAAAKQPDPEIEKLRKELEDARAKLAFMEEPVNGVDHSTDPTTPPPAPGATATAVTTVHKPEVIVSKQIPVLTMPGRAIDVTEYGYDFQNVHIRRDVPINVLALAFMERMGSGERPDKTKELFIQAQDFINLYGSSVIRKAMRVQNGFITYGAETYPIPQVNPEVVLRVIEDRWKTDRKIRGWFAGKKDVQWALAKMSIEKTLKALG